MEVEVLYSAGKGKLLNGKGVAGDCHLAKFFDRVNHDLPMARVARKVKDTRVLAVIRRFPQAGLMRDGLVQPRREGTPQGGPLSAAAIDVWQDLHGCLRRKLQGRLWRQSKRSLARARMR